MVSAGAAYFGRSLLGTLFLWLIGGQMIFLCLSAFLVDGLLKANFNEDGLGEKAVSLSPSPSCFYMKTDCRFYAGTS